MQLAAIVVSLVISVIGFGLLGRTAVYIYQFVKLGQSTVPGARSGQPLERTKTLFREFAIHTRLARKGKRWIGAMHWVVMVGFGLLFFTLVTAYGQLFSADFAIPLIGRWWPFEFVTEVVSFVMILAIIGLIGVRLRNRPAGAGSKEKGKRSRFFGSTMWQGYFVEWVILLIGVCIMLLRGFEGALGRHLSYSAHYPVSYPLIHAFDGMSRGALENGIYTVAMIKIVISMIWAITIGLNSTMSVAWHRFLAFPNIWFKKKDDGGTALGALSPMVSGGVPIDFEDPAEDAKFGVGAVEDFTWKGLLDFSTCTECGRCQDQCPAWNTDKPLSPKLLMLGLRDHAAAKAPYLFAGGGKDLEGNEKLAEEKWLSLPDLVRAEAERPLIGTAEENGVIDPDILWSCTTCGACVEQCPVDIEHVDHIVDMRRYQVMIESSFPSEAGTMLKNLEKAQNPWGMQPKKRTEWIAELDFEVPVFGETLEDISEVEYLYWVGCAGSLEDRAKKTTKAFAELLHIAGVKFAVLGGMESCTGDPARRLGNEFLFQMLGQGNVEMLNEVFGEDTPREKRKIVATCPHCFNSLANEYPQLGGEYEVIHHTQLLDTLVSEGKLTPVTPIDQNITYHDPCYLGRHNKVYTPPREIIAKVPGLKNTEMHRCKEKGFCCGAGGARMWMEERLGKRINVERVDEALSTNPDVISTACPYCLVMLGDSITARKQAGEVPESMEVVDVAQLLLTSVKPAPAPANA
ncbi:(Fe-S)-binding protein [Catenulispora sp. NF23]|uniref:(Fe-S)-binding protein n=1 Tax=Catenulispora pinistramenti TaxID=2705254 RepID=UPI001BA72360|nr:(Fe-S)-binding protein [Catenulispora pinistramenti]MBS2533527.1 (Fe-S)-binding protein [Catenulispora pinistramenti]